MEENISHLSTALWIPKEGIAHKLLISLITLSIFTQLYFFLKICHGHYGEIFMIFLRIFIFSINMMISNLYQNMYSEL